MQVSGKCTGSRTSHRNDFFLERSGCYRRTSDFNGICCVLRREAGLSDHGCHRSCIFCSSDQTVYERFFCGGCLSVGIYCRGQKCDRSPVVPDSDERHLFYGSVDFILFIQKKGSAGSSCKLSVSSYICLLFFSDAGYYCES